LLLNSFLIALPLVSIIEIFAIEAQVQEFSIDQHSLVVAQREGLAVDQEFDGLQLVDYQSFPVSFVFFYLI